MFNRFKEIVRKVLKSMFNQQSKIKTELDIDIAISDVMSRALDLWTRMYQNDAPWLNETTKSMNLASAVAGEIARLVTLELKSEVSGNDYLNDEYQVVLESIRILCEYACAYGGIAFKPYVANGKIEVDTVLADSFYPTAYNSRNEITGAVFIETKTKGKDIYTRLEYHNLTEDGYQIINRAYKKHNVDISDKDEDIGREIELTEVEEWADLEEEVLIQNVTGPLFSYFRIPIANQIDSNSPLGVSVYSKAIDDIKEADRQYSRILWEYEGSELAVDADADCFKLNDQGETILPEGKERLFRTYEFNDNAANKAINTFSPEIRDTSLFNGLNNLLRQIEFKCGLAYGTLSDPQNVDKTAEEIKASKQRSYQLVSDIQKALQKALEQLVYAMSVIGQISDLPTGAGYTMSFNWDDSIIIDKKEEMQSMQQDVASGILRAEIYLAKKYGVTEEEALKMMPQTTPVTPSPFDESE